MTGTAAAEPDDPLVLGPLLRHVDTTSASVWVETRDAATVAVVAGEARAQARTFRVHGHHFALVELSDLPPGSRHAYTVSVDGDRVWPPAGSPYPDPVIATLEPDGPLRVAFGSCRTAVGHDAEGHSSHGVDALRTYALCMAGQSDPHDPEDRDLADPRWPDLMLFLGDQVYADETTEPMQDFIASRRDITAPPWSELRDFEEYAHLYRLAWSEPVNRWLLATLPSAMIFDDHDIRDDWNTSLEWRREMEATTWWHDRIVGGLASYWVYQHLGNLSPAARAQDELWQRVAAHDGAEELDLTDSLDAFAARVDREPDSYRWSYARDFGDRARLVVLDSRAARVLEPERRAMLDPVELHWLDQQMRGGVDHLLVGTSVPFLLARGLHHLEAFGEALAGGRWGRAGAALGERLRQTVDLEHWAAFQDTFHAVGRMATEVAAGQRGRAPGTVTFLSGDVHHSYVSEARPRRRSGVPAWESAVLQAVCSPIRNPLSRNMRFATAALSYGVAGPLGRIASWSAKVPDTPITWRYARGPWFDNNLACLELAGRGLRMWWLGSTVVDDDHAHPRLTKVADYRRDVSARDGG